MHVNEQDSVVIWGEGSILLLELAEEISKYPADELDQITIIMPTQRLATYFLFYSWRKIKAFCPPRCLTLEGLLNEYADVLPHSKLISHQLPMSLFYLHLYPSIIINIFLLAMNTKLPSFSVKSLSLE